MRRVWGSIVLVLASVFMGVVGLGVQPAQAVDGAVACTLLNGGVRISPGITVTPHSNHFDFESKDFTCAGLGPDAGTWNVKATADSDATETCAAATGNGQFTSGSGPSQTVTGGRFTFVRVATTVFVSGEVITSNGVHHEFVAVLEFIPDEGDCVATPVTHAQVKGGLAVGSGI
jgi:hypothetical protein